MKSNMQNQSIKIHVKLKYRATNGTAVTSLHPFIYATKVIMVRAFCNYLRIFISIFCKTEEKYNIHSTDILKSWDKFYKAGHVIVFIWDTRSITILSLKLLDNLQNIYC